MTKEPKETHNAGTCIFALSVSAEELERVPALYRTMLVVQTLGAIAGLALLQLDDWVFRLFCGAFLATLPGFILGLPVQAHFRPGTFSENRTMVIRFGFIALAATLAGLVMLLGYFND